jgi:hypothetical protein
VPPPLAGDKFNPAAFWPRRQNSQQDDSAESQNMVKLNSMFASHQFDQSKEKIYSCDGACFGGASH